MFDPTFQPMEIARVRHKVGVWVPYEWVGVDRLSETNLRPDEAMGICRQVLSQS